MTCNLWRDSQSGKTFPVPTADALLLNHPFKIRSTTSAKHRQLLETAADFPHCPTVGFSLWQGVTSWLPLVYPLMHCLTKAAVKLRISVCMLDSLCEAEKSTTCSYSQSGMGNLRWVKHLKQRDTDRQVQPCRADCHPCRGPKYGLCRIWVSLLQTCL